MVTNVPFYSFKDLSLKRSVPFAAIVLVALGIAVINIDPPTVLFGLFVVYGLSGYAVFIWRKAKGRPTSVISTSTDEPEERGLHEDELAHRARSPLPMARRQCFVIHCFP